MAVLVIFCSLAFIASALLFLSLNWEVSDGGVLAAYFSVTDFKALISAAHIEKSNALIG